MSDQITTSFNNLNYSGMLFNTGNTRTPLSSIIGSRLAHSNSTEFVVGQTYAGTAAASQPAISETASLTAPDAVSVTRAQVTNVTQIFQQSVYISDVHEANMARLSGANIALQEANPQNELDFQIGTRMAQIARDIEYTFIQGAYNKATTDATVNKSRGLTTAITTNVTAMNSKPLGLWDVAEMQKKIYESNAPIDDLTLWCDTVTMFQINADAEQNGLTIVPAARDINGIQLAQLITPLGPVWLRLGECLPSGTALLLNLGVIRPVDQPHPTKGNFYIDPLGKTGAGQKYLIHGLVGLDHGIEQCHGKWTGLATTFTKPDYTKSVFISNTSSSPVPTQEVTG